VTTGRAASFAGPPAAATTSCSEDPDGNGEALDVTTVVLFGQGYVGLPLAMRAVAVGYHVVGFDTDLERVKRLGAGESYVDDVPSSQLSEALATRRYRPTSDAADCAGFDVALITVPTPLRDGVPDLSFVEAAGRVLGAHLRPGVCVVLESTTYPGTTEELLGPILEEVSGLVAGDDFHLGYSPERMDPGNGAWDVVNIPKVVSGVNAASLKVVQAFYDSIVTCTVPVSRPSTAEMVKLVENTFRHVNVALVNELAMFAHDLDVDIWEALDAATTKPFGFMRFDPGPGVGGHCLPIDPSYLSWRVKRQLGCPFRFVELANDVNDHMPQYVVRRLTHALNEHGQAVNGRRILLLGLAYKPNTGDVRESPGLALAEQLVALGATVRACDPHVDPAAVEGRLVLVDLCPEEIDAADAVVLLTDHRAFDYDLVTSRARYVLDTRGRLSGARIERF
jgi:UDP-N-acetyl-D-glucosamine dehydrogenase